LKLNIPYKIKRRPNRNGLLRKIMILIPFHQISKGKIKRVTNPRIGFQGGD